MRKIRYSVCFEMVLYTSQLDKRGACFPELGIRNGVEKIFMSTYFSLRLLSY